MAANDVADLLLRIDATTEGLRRELKKAEGAVGKSSTGMTTNVQKLEKKFQSLASTIGTGMKIGAGLFAGAAAVVVRNTIAQEKSIAQLEATLRSTGRYTPELSAQLQAYASELQGVTTFGDEAIIASQGLLRTFTQLGGEQFPRAQKAILDVATAMGMDLKSATLQVGKALNDPILGLTALQRSGIQFSESQKEMIKSMVAAGDTAGAQTMILKELETQFGGSAEAARNTLGGALQGLKNAFGDLLEGDSGGDGVRGATESINELTDTLSSPEAAQAFSAFTEAMVGTIEWIIETTNVIKFLTDETKAFFGVIAENDIPRLEDRIENLNNAMEINARSILPWVRDRNIELAKEVAELTERLEAARKGFVSTGNSAGSAADDIAENLDPVEALGDQAGKTAKELAELNKQLEASLDNLYPGRRATRELQEEYRRLEEALKDGLIAQKDFDNWIEKNVLAEVTVTARRHVKDLQDEADPFAKAWEQAMERIDTAFADAWKGAFDSFSDFADGLKNAFKQLLAEMAHAAITRPILVSLGLVGGSSGAVAGTAGGGLGNISSIASIGSALKGGVSGIGSSIAGAGSSLMTGVGHGASFLADIGIPGMNELAVGAYQQGMTLTAGSALAGAAAGFAGSFLGNKVFGQTSGIGSTLGSVAGFALGGPIGSAIGGFLGSGVESLFGGGPSNNFASQTMNFATGAMKQRGGGQNLEGSQSIMEQLAAFNQAIGGSTAAVEVGIGDRTGFELRTGSAAGGRSRSERFKTAVEVLAAAMDEIIEKSTDLAEPVKQLALNFAGAEEDLARYTVALKGIWEMTERDPFEAAVDDIKTATENAAKTAMEVYRDQADALRELVQGFDGSVDSTIKLHDALAQTQAVSYQLGIIFEQVSQQVGSLFGNLRESIRTSMMSEAELYEFQRSQVLSLTEQLEALTDPEAILATAQQIEKITASMWSGLDAFQRAEMGEEFLSYLDSTQALAEERLQKGMSEMEQSSKENNQLIQDGIRSAAVELQNSASMYSFSAQQMLDAAQMFFQASQQMMSGTMSEVNR